MMLFKLSLKNIQKSIKDYTIYFFTLVLGVAVFYVFNSIEKQTAMLNLTKSSYEIIKLLVDMMSGVSIFVSFILGFLIIYASRFLIKRRKKEFGVYMTLGMGKMKISRILLFETVMIGAISLVIGLLVGVGLSQVMSVIVANMFEADMSEYRFVYSNSATIKTIIYFGIMYILVMFFNVFSVSKCKLITLLQAGKKNERVKIKNPYICIVVFIIAAAILARAYYSVTQGYAHMTSRGMYTAVIEGCVGTLLLFWSLSGLILKIIRSAKGIYRKNLNTFILRQLDSKINTMVISMTLISLMLFSTICILASALTLNDALTGDLKKYASIDFEANKQWNLINAEQNPDRYSKAQIEDSKLSIRETMDKMDFDIDKQFKDVLEINTFISNEVTMEDMMGAQIDKVKKKYPLMAFSSAEDIIRVSDYNKIAKMTGQKTVSVEEDEFVFACDVKGYKNFIDASLKEDLSITVNGKAYTTKYDKCVDSFIHMSNGANNIGLIILPDDAVDESMKSRSMFYANYKADDKEGKRAIEDELQEAAQVFEDDSTQMMMMTKIILYESSRGLSSMVVFVGMYLGIIFLITCAAILALKELSDSSDNRDRYDILRRIGADERMINRSLFVQVGLFFLFPLMVAIMHSVFGIMFVNKVFESFVSDGMLPSIIFTAAVLCVIYGGYFTITYLCSRNIIREKIKQ